MSASVLAAAVTCGSSVAHAVVVNGLFIEDPRCDILPTQSLPHELGEVSVFPIIQSFFSTVQPTTTYICVPDDLVQNDWLVEIRNTSGIAWTNLFFVDNLGMSIGNADGVVMDVTNAPGVVADAFRIDGTVTAGGNANLIFESMGVNEIFEPGESWQFLVTNFMHASGVAPPPLFNTPGLFGGSAPVIAAFPDTASILATPVPEPGTWGVAALGAASLMLRRRRR
jgi:hypothetical protein